MTERRPSPLDKYLRLYAEDEIGLAASLSQHWQQVVCIPVYDEAELLPPLLQRLQKESELLCILVFNSPADSLAEEGKHRTQELAQTLIKNFPLEHEIDNTCHLLQLNTDNSHLLLIQRFGLLAHEGVGKARKIACDLACKLIADARIESKWIHNTDADVTLPDDYFEQKPDPTFAAAIYRFRHVLNPDSLLQQAMHLYEYSLHYYLAGLAHAGSPYAYYTIGSTLLINHQFYAKVRGFPKRSGAEDFYLLNKLVKLAPVKQLDSEELLISSRISSRVPFGTGPALQQIIRLNEPKRSYDFYHPNCFEYLKLLLERFPHFRQTQHWQTLISDELLLKYLEKTGFEDTVLHARKHASTDAVFEKHLHDWFDALRSLKLIHWLRDNGLSSISYHELQQYKSSHTFISKANQLMPIFN
jgi:hypothetical protein